MTGGEAVGYHWYLNSTSVATTSTYTIPNTAKAGDVVSVSIIDEDGDTATDSVIVVEAEELALERVEGANGAARTVLLAYFSEPVEDLQPGDIEIRRVSNNQLNTVEKVVLSSDGMTATLYLVGFEAGTAQALDANTDYKMIVTTDAGTAEKVFALPLVVDDVRVASFNTDNNTISTKSSEDAAVNNNAKLDEDLDIDFNNLLGRTVTYEINADNIITKLTPANETVIYGAFVRTKADAATTATTQIKDVLTKETYDFVSATAGSTYKTVEYDIDGKSASPANFVKNAAIAATEPTIAYAKVVLNGNGTVRTIVNLAAWTDNALVTGISGDSIQCGKEEVNLKDYTILKDGETITIDDIEEGDVVFYNTTKKIADVYTSSDTGVISAVYTDSFTVNGDNYKFASGKYIDGTRKALTADKLNSFKSSGEDAEVYFDRTGAVIYVTGEDGEAETEKTTIVLTQAAVIQPKGLDNIVYLEGYNADSDAIEQYEVNVSDITSLASTATTGTTTTKKATSTVKPGVTGTASVDLDGLSLSNAAIGDNLAPGKIITLTSEVASGKIVGIASQLGAALGAIDDDAAIGGGEVLKNSAKTINGVQVSPSAKVYSMTGATTDAGLAVADKYTKGSAVAYSDWSSQVSIGAARTAGTMTTALAGDVQVFVSGGKVNAIVLNVDTNGNGNKNAFGANAEAGTPFTAIVAEFKEGTTGTDSALTVVSAAGEYTYTSFKTGYNDAAVTLDKGALITLTPVKSNDEQVFSVASIATSATTKGGARYIQTSTTGDFLLTATAWSKTSDALIFAITSSGAETITFDQLNGTLKPVYAHKLVGSTANVADVIVVDNTAANVVTQAQMDAAQAEYARIKAITYTATIDSAANADNLITCSDTTAGANLVLSNASTPANVAITSPATAGVVKIKAAAGQNPDAVTFDLVYTGTYFVGTTQGTITGAADSITAITFGAIAITAV